MQGKVVWFSDKKGYGFIKEDVSGVEYFVHYSGIKEEGYKSLSEGDSVEFEVDKNGIRGELAIGVVKL